MFGLITTQCKWALYISSLPATSNNSYRAGLDTCGYGMAEDYTGKLQVYCHSKYTYNFCPKRQIDIKKECNKHQILEITLETP